MSDKKNNPSKPRFTPIVEDVELPEAEPVPGKKGESAPDRENPAPKRPETPPKQTEYFPNLKETAPKPEKAAPKQPDPAPERMPEDKESVNPDQAAQKSASEESDSAEKQADSSKKRKFPLFGKKEVPEETEADEPNQSAAAKETAITESGMLRKDDEIDRSIFAEVDGINPASIGFSPDTEVSAAALVGVDENRGLSFENLDIEEDDSGEKIVRRVKIRKRSERGASLRTLGYGICYLVVVILLGVILGSKIVGIGNDIFSFTFETDSDGNPVSYTVVIDDEGMSPAEVGKLLKEAGVIKYDWVFKLYAQMKKKDNFKVTAGTYSVSAAANYDAIMSILNPVPPREEIEITFTEGMNTDEIINLFLENGIGTREGFERALNSYPYSYWFMDYLKGNLPEGRFYRLDGYLYPDTYKFFSDTGEIAAIDKLLANFDKKFGEEYKVACDDLGMTPDEVVRLASMIEAEVKFAADYVTVSSVFHNRMKSREFDGLLQSDATVQYYFYHTEGARHEEITPEDLLAETPYNTYLNKGLPPGAVCSPTMTALRAALYPEEDCPYYYFVSRPNGHMYYAKTLAEHNANIEKAKEEAENPGVGEYEEQE